MREGSLEAPTRHALDWRNPAFYDAEALDEELRRVFDICHTCRRCFNLCDSFPRLFDLIDDPARRAALLSRLGGVEERVTITVADETIAGVPEDDVERSTDEGRASSVQFLHFPFSPAKIAAFRDPLNRVVVAVDHARYGHMAVMPEAVREALAGDFE